MIVIMRDAVMPDCCNTCVCSEGYGCGITGTVMTTKEMEERPDWCPLEEQEPCEDTISRQAAIDVIDAILPVEPMKNEYTQGITCGAALAIEYVKQLPSAQPEQRWIPCSERLPETHKAGNSVSGISMESKPVLVYGVPEYESEYSFNVVTYCDDLNGNTYWSTEMDAVTINEVTAWMPLPEPYKERREE